MPWMSVAMGGALGALARYGLLLWLPPQSGRFPFATFFANFCGCFLAGALYVMIVQKGIIPPSLKPFVTVGFLGAFTTFSTFSLDALLLWQNQQIFMASLYIAASVLGCFMAVWLGYAATNFYFSQ